MTKVECRCDWPMGTDAPYIASCLAQVLIEKGFRDVSVTVAHLDDDGNPIESETGVAEFKTSYSTERR